MFVVIASHQQLRMPVLAFTYSFLRFLRYSPSQAIAEFLLSDCIDVSPANPPDTAAQPYL
jgi:hypothetical protein